MIFITARKRPEFRQQKAQLETIRFFEKAYGPDELLTALRAAVGD
jgi:hypothetical protein